MVEKHEHIVAGAKIGSQNSWKVAELLYDRSAPNRQIVNDSLGLFGGHSMIEPNELCQNPAYNPDHKIRILYVWIDAVGEVRSITVIPDVVHHSQGAWDVKPN